MVAVPVGGEVQAILDALTYIRAIQVMAMLLIGFGFLSLAIPLDVTKDALGLPADGAYSLIDRLVLSEFAAASLLIAAGAVLGRLTMAQYLLLGVLLFLPFYALDEWILSLGGLGWLPAGKFVDMGGSILIHAFGALFGVAAALSPPGGGSGGGWGPPAQGSRARTREPEPIRDGRNFPNGPRGSAPQALRPWPRRSGGWPVPARGDRGRCWIDWPDLRLGRAGESRRDGGDRRFGWGWCRRHHRQPGWERRKRPGAAGGRWRRPGPRRGEKATWQDGRKTPPALWLSLPLLGRVPGRNAANGAQSPHRRHQIIAGPIQDQDGSDVAD